MYFLFLLWISPFFELDYEALDGWDKTKDEK